MLLLVWISGYILCLALQLYIFTRLFLFCYKKSKLIYRILFCKLLSDLLHTWSLKPKEKLYHEIVYCFIRVKWREENSVMGIIQEKSHNCSKGKRKMFSFTFQYSHFTFQKYFHLLFPYLPKLNIWSIAMCYSVYLRIK